MPIRSVIAALALSGTALVAAPAPAGAATGSEVTVHPEKMSHERAAVMFEPEKISHERAVEMFEEVGITWSSVGNCSDREDQACTSFEELNWDTARAAQVLKLRSGCDINIVGGTERGHPSEPYSHAEGFRLDYSFNSCLEDFVVNNYRFIENRPDDDVPRYWTGMGNYFTQMSDHWEGLYFTCESC
ncbi:hypothetical protein ACWGNE_08500 [Streptomyces xiamenensis]